MILQTQRLYLREMTQKDYGDLCKILQDAQVMVAYAHSFPHQEVQQWLDNQLARYAKYGFGLWAVVRKEDNQFIGQCGLSMQDCKGEQVVEVGYLFQKAFWHQGYATEAAVACKNYAFDKLKAQEVYAIIRDTNIPSQKVAISMGMTPKGQLIKHYQGIDMPHYIYSTKE